MLKQSIKAFAKSAVRNVSRALRSLPGGKYLFQQLLESGMEEQRLVQHGGVEMALAAPNALCRYRAESFSSKEPDTITWLDAISPGAILWDIGANVGLYSLYAAKSRGARVFAFEPSVFNLELLARNIFLNQLQQQVVIVPVALSSQLGPSLFRMSTTQWGGALSTFGEEYGQDGKTLASLFEYQTCGMRMDDVCAQLGLALPQYIKIDVDGIEHLILRGGASVLRGAQSVLIEIDDGFLAQADESTRHLKEAGLKLYRKCALDAGRQYNQWWVREEPVSF